jgi:hypothetical protein
MTKVFDDKYFRGLVAWCGFWQACHLILNIQYCLGKVEFPLPPPDGWTSQAHRIFDGIVAGDLLQSLIALVFVAGFFLRKRWSLVWGLVSLSSSMFGSFSFTYFIVGTGAWTPHAAHYYAIQVLWAPLVVLFVWICRALSEGPAVAPKPARSLPTVAGAVSKR